MAIFHCGRQAVWIGRRWSACIVFLLAISSASSQVVAQESTPESFEPRDFDLTLEPVAGGFERPVYVADPGDGSGRLFVVEQQGRIRIVRDGQLIDAPFLDVTDRVESSGNEQGLLSIAFDPDFAENGRFFIGYTGQGPTNVVSRFQISEEDPGLADPNSERILFSIDDPFPNHNGGLVQFGPDGNLYVGFGDGGSGGDPLGNAQNLGVLLGKILRIDVSGDFPDDEAPYRVPGDNPFVGQAGSRPEIWAYGLRNPWRFSFDRATGDLYIADVGQGEWEEVNYAPADSDGGENYGWNLMEGKHCYADGSDCSPDGLILPIAEYGHDQGSAVTGGYVYRRAASPSLAGVYLFADFGSGLLWGLGRGADGGWLMSDPIDTGLNISSFGEDAAGEVYVTAFDGTVYRVTAS